MVSVDVTLWSVVREHGEPRPIVMENEVKDILLKDFLKKHPHAEHVGAEFSYLDLAYVPKPGHAKRWVPRWLAAVQTSHPGSDTPAAPMKPTIESYEVDAWTGRIIGSERALVPLDPVRPPEAPSPAVEDSPTERSHKPGERDNR